jgi:predicted GIY-YIG superfamily endonuclease
MYERVRARAEVLEEDCQMPHHHHVYVVELDPRVMRIRAFASENPDHDPGKPCVYVGMTGKSPEQRFAEHKTGHKSGRFVRRFGRELLPGLYQDEPAMPYADAQKREVELAKQLRALGNAVWQR